MTARAPYRLHGATYNLSPAWISAIESFLLAQRARGYPDTTITARRQHLSNLAANIGVPDPFAITPAQLVEWAGTRDWANETRRSRRTTYLAFYRWAFNDERTQLNPAAALERVKATKPHPRPTPEPVYAQALARASPRLSTMLRLGGDLGMRRGEIAVVHTRDLFADLDGWSLTVHGKGNKERDLPLSRRLALELSSTPEGWLFPGAIDGHLSPRRVGELLDDGLDGDWTGHSLRHRAAGRWRRLGADLSEIQRLLGHASPATTMTYTPVFDDRLRAIIDDAAA